MSHQVTLPDYIRQEGRIYFHQDRYRKLQPRALADCRRKKATARSFWSLRRR